MTLWLVAHGVSVLLHDLFLTLTAMTAGRDVLQLLNINFGALSFCEWYHGRHGNVSVE